jgi:two-component system alkaline phosphatase synthesis response regulator PhoP
MPVAWYTDDDEEMTRAVRLMLHLLGYEMRSFYSARTTARTLLAGESPDILLLDINLPEVSGLDLLEFIRRRPQWNHLPVIMLSSEATDVQVDHAMQLGADAYMFKPVTVEELETTLQQAQRHRQATNENGPA